MAVETEELAVWHSSVCRDGESPRVSTREASACLRRRTSEETDREILCITFLALLVSGCVHLYSPSRGLLLFKATVVEGEQYGTMHTHTLLAVSQGDKRLHSSTPIYHHTYLCVCERYLLQRGGWMYLQVCVCVSVCDRKETERYMIHQCWQIDEYLPNYTLVLAGMQCVHTKKVTKIQFLFDSSGNGHCCPIMQCTREIEVWFTAGKD